MKTEQEKKLYMRLLEITAQSRFSIMREIWNLDSTEGISIHELCRDSICRELTELRNGIFRTITSEEFSSYETLVKGIAEYEDMTQIRKNIAIMAIYNIDIKCIAAINCINVAYVRDCISTLEADFPELFG